MRTNEGIIFKLAAISYDDILNVQTARQQFNYPALVSL